MLPKHLFDKRFFSSIRENVEVVAQLSIIYVCNQQTQKKENVIIAREAIHFFLVMIIFQDFVFSFLSFLN